MNKTPADTNITTAFPESSNNPLLDRSLSFVFWGFLAVLLAVYCAGAIANVDFWWHLKSGDVMLNQRGLLNSDPFNFTSDAVVDRRESLILKGYWLWQVAAALLYRMWGMYGIFVLKAATLLLLIAGILREMRRQSVSPFVQMLLTGLGSVVTVAVIGLDRPYIFSFIFATTLLGMVAQVRLGHPPSWFLAPLMVLWANIHGGFIVGDMLLIIFAAGAVIQYRTERNRLIPLLWWAGAGIAASFANPAGWSAVLETFSFMQQSMDQNIVEFKSSWSHFTEARQVGLLWLIALLHITGLLFSRKVFWPEILISLFLIAFGLKYMRNEGFVALSLLPMTGWYLDQMAAGRGYTLPRFWRTGVLLALSALFVWQTTLALDKTKNGWPVSDYFPEKMALFLDNSGLSGHLLSDHGRAGYFNWALYPKWQTFIDTRSLNYLTLDKFITILAAAKNHEALLDQYAVSTIALPISMENGRVQPLLKVLLNNPRWIPVYLDRGFFALARNSEENGIVIKRFGVDKKEFINRLLVMYSASVNQSPGDVEFATCYTELLIYAGKYSEAETMLSKMERIQPGADIVSVLRRQIDTLNVKKQ